MLYDLCPGGRKFTAICQYPELPTGCEVTALAMVLGFYGQDVDKCELSDKYLDKGKIGETEGKRNEVRVSAVRRYIVTLEWGKSSEGCRGL